MNAAFLGNAVCSRAGLDWERYGFLKLSDVLRKLESEGRLRLVTDPKSGLTVFTTDAENAPSRELAAEATPSPVPRTATFGFDRALKKPVWNAFVASTPTNPRFLNVHTAEAWLTPDGPPTPADDWKPVNPIPADEQRKWARDFVSTVGLAADRELDESLAKQDWFRVFPLLLSTKRDLSTTRAWNRARSEHVVQHVEAWAKQHAVRPEILFEDYRKQRGQRPSTAAPTDLRAALLDALNRLSVDDLLSMPIPARHLVAVIRPDLLRER